MSLKAGSVPWSWRLALLVVAVAASLRLAFLHDIPFGWHPDEATKALLARDVLAGKYFPAFFSAFTGREALYVYLEALSFALLGERIFAARLLSAFAGVLTVALTYTIGKQLFNRRTGLLAALFLATSLWHLIASRNGYRAVIQPLVQLPALLLLFDGLLSSGRRSRNSFAMGGVWLGLTQYTYTAARFFPLVLVAIVIATAVCQRRLVWARRRGLALMVIVAVIVFLPLALHFLRNPIDFYGRAAQVSVFSSDWAGDRPWQRLWQSARETARMFTVWGDINYRFNITGKPVFGIVDGLLFYAGLLGSLWQLGKGKGHQRLAYVTILLWTSIMLLPMTLSAESLPYYQRAIGILPAVYFFPALALDGVVERLQQRSTLRTAFSKAAAPLLTVGLLVWLGTRAYVDYFERWHLTPRNDDDRRVAMVYVADYLKQTAPRGELFLSTQYVQHPTLALLAPAFYDQVKWFDATQSLPLPRPGRDSRYILLLENDPAEMLLATADGLRKQYTALDRFQRPVFDVYRWRASEWPIAEDTTPAAWSAQVNFDPDGPNDFNHIALPVNVGDVLAFRGHDRQPEQVQPGQILQIVLYWEILSRPQRQYTFFVHLLDADSQVVAGYDANTYPSSFWPEHGGELLLSYFPLQVPTDLEAGTYQLEIGVYHQPSGERLPVIEHGAFVADRLLLAPVRLEAGG